MKRIATVRSCDGVAVGDVLPTLRVTVTEVSNFLFGVAFWTAHRVHYDKELARAEGFDAPLVSGALMSAYASRVLVQWAGHPHAVRRVTSRNLASAVVGDTLDITGRVESVDPGGLVTCALTVSRGDTGVMAVTAVVQLALGR